MNRIPLRWALLGIFGAVTIAATAVVSGANYLLARQNALSGAAALIAEVNRSLDSQLRLLFEPQSLATLALSMAPSLSTVPPALDHPALGMLRAMLDAIPSTQSIYVGYENGDFLRVVQLAGTYSQNRTVLGAPDNAAVGIQLVVNSKAPASEMWRFLDDTGAIFGERTQPAAYDPRVRPWYRSATAANGFIVTSPYIIASTAEVGVTLAQPALGRSGVVGADMTLTAVSNYLADLKRSWTYPVALAVFDSEQQVVATSQPLPEGAGAQFVHVVDLHDAGITAAATQFGTTGQAFNRATLQTPAGAMMASVQPVPFEIGEARHFFAIVAPLDAFVVPLLRTAQQSILVGILIALLSVPFILVFATRLAGPMRALAEESERVRRLEIGSTLHIRSRIREVSDLAASTNLMRSTLAAFAKYVPRELVHGILDSGMAPMPGGGRRPVTLLFTDIEGFTTLSEQIEPEALMLKMSSYLERMVTEIFRHDGTVDKYVGDAIMAYWNAPRYRTNHAVLGCRAALGCRALSNAMNQDWQAAGEAPLYTRFGLHTGDSIVGNVGSSTRLDFTVLGATVNLASRLEGLNKHYGTQILVSEAIRAEAGDNFVFRPVDVVLPKGSVNAVPIHELVGVRADSDEAAILPGAVLSPRQEASCAEWRRIYELFGRGEWAALIAEIGAYTRAHPNDKLAAVYLKRAWVSAFSPPDANRAQRFYSK